mmetsp:Transcript_32100/g.36496  ORF Transcript_32100/g.36496 Transcript_32100/m.36496 type:complete len:188 (+) Transcript_32100:735-1298(+)
MTKADNIALAEEAKYSIPCELMLVLPSTFPAVVTPAITPRLDKLMDKAIKEPIFSGVDPITSPTTAELDINNNGNTIEPVNFDRDTKIAGLLFPEKNDAPTIALTMDIANVAIIMTGLRPMESDKLPKMGLSIISNAAAKLDNVDKIDVARLDPNLSIKIGGGDNPTNTTANVINNDDSNIGFNDMF